MKQFKFKEHFFDKFWLTAYQFQDGECELNYRHPNTTMMNHYFVIAPTKKEALKKLLDELEAWLVIIDDGKRSNDWFYITHALEKIKTLYEQQP